MLSKVTPIVLLTILCMALMTEASVKVDETDSGDHPILGGETDIDVNDEAAIQAATFATAELNSRSNGRYSFQHQRIIEATEQVVAGVMYRITMDVTVTSADNGESKIATCTVTVWDQSWRTPRYTLEVYKCDL